jgi:hypothetical protein
VVAMISVVFLIDDDDGEWTVKERGKWQKVEGKKAKGREMR